MSGTAPVKALTKVLDLPRKDGGQGTVADQIKASPSASAEDTRAKRESGEMVAARRRARAGGRMLLSDARLNPEQGVSTLGQSGV